MSELIVAALALGLTITFIGSLTLIIALPTFMVSALYNRLRHGRWGRREPTLPTAAERKAYYEKQLAQSPQIEAFRSVGIWLLYIAPLLIGLNLMTTDDLMRIDDRDLEAFLYLSFFNAALLSLLNYRLMKRRNSTKLKLTKEIDAANAEDRAAEARKRAEQQEQWERETTQRREREEAYRRAQEKRAEQTQREERQRQRKSSEDRAREGHSSHIPWHKVLGVSPDASADEIKKAYLHLIKQYHPDMVFSLGDELKELAARKATEINRAYAEAMAGR